jgi:hypothetical protein
MADNRGTVGTWVREGKKADRIRERLKVKGKERRLTGPEKGWQENDRCAAGEQAGTEQG